MPNLVQPTSCSGCGACAAICPRQSISMTPDWDGFRYPKIQNDLCVNCGLCEKVCPVLNKTIPEEAEQTALAAICLDEDIRNASSSGGVFSLIARHILDQGGVVFGAALTEDLTVTHIGVTDPEELYRLRGSKYVQSDIADTYRQAKSYLKEGRPVLFTGTPCQIAGLRAFLGEDDPNLFCQDLVCHGAPSPMVWKQYLQYRQKENGSKAVRVSFRDKSLGWNRFSLRIEFEDGSIYSQPLQKDPYMKAFLTDLSLRSSCYQCSFKGQQRLADITLADFWGVHDILPQMYDDKGTSLVFLNTRNGHMLFDSISDQLKVCPADSAAAIRWNSAMLHSVREPKARAAFMEEIAQGDFPATVNKHLPTVSTCKRLVQKGKRVIKKLLGRA